MGLGLAAARGTVSLLAGRISAQSPHRGGIEFLSASPADASARSAPPHSGAAPSSLRRTTPAIRDLACRVLGKEGYRVLAASDGAEAVELFEGNTERIRLAILDDVMPKAGGRAVLGRIRVKSPSLPVILCTGYAWGVQESVPRPGMEEILAKPYEPRDLLRCVRRVLGNGRENAP